MVTGATHLDMRLHQRHHPLSSSKETHQVWDSRRSALMPWHPTGTAWRYSIFSVRYIQGEKKNMWWMFSLKWKLRTLGPRAEQKNHQIIPCHFPILPPFHFRSIFLCRRFQTTHSELLFPDRTTGVCFGLGRLEIRVLLSRSCPSEPNFKSSTK